MNNRRIRIIFPRPDVKLKEPMEIKNRVLRLPIPRGMYVAIEGAELEVMHPTE